jgi:hypothetical protein
MLHLVGFYYKTLPVGSVALSAHDNVTNECNAAELESLQGK